VAFKKSGELDPNKAIIVACVGKKRSGKSQLARVLFDSFPGDRVVIDLSGDDGPFPDKERSIFKMPDPTPVRWPEHLRAEGRPMTLYFRPDPGSATFIEDQDEVIGLTLRHGPDKRTAVLVHEMGILARSGEVKPHAKRLLHHNRHRNVTLIACAPRPITMDSLVISQSDLVYVFKLPNPNDRRRIAENIGWDPADFDAAVHDLGEHEYLRYDDSAPEPDDGRPNLKLVHFPALPADVIRQVGRTAGH
jgi:hypothetical protein